MNISLVSDRDLAGCEIVVPVTLQVHLLLQLEVSGLEPVCYPQVLEPASPTLEPALESKPERLDETPVIFRPEFNHFAIINAAQAFSLFFTAGRWLGPT
ncbi:MAG: hypothetical protein F6K19_27245 [Cyanothece sp. SIO1E1]|nr:hypothetical protein [Cyanothece sp. SIO1E1]